MPLEFALRPRFKLERSTPERKRRVRLSPLALPMLAYWLAIAGVTRTLIRAASDDTTDGDAANVAPLGAAAADLPEDSEAVPNPAPALPSPPATATQRSLVSAPSEPAFAPPPMLRATFDSATDDERNPEPSKKPATPAPPRATTAPHDPLASLGSDAARAPKAATTTLVAPAPRFRERDDALFEPATRPRERDDAPVEREPARGAREPERDDGRVASLPSCESAAATTNQDIDLRSGPGAPDLTRDAFAAVLENGSYLAQCAIPARTALSICAAVKDGKAVGVTVASQPQNADINACVRRAVAGLRFPQNARLDVTHTRFEAAH